MTEDAVILTRGSRTVQATIVERSIGFLLFFDPLIKQRGSGSRPIAELPRTAAPNTRLPRKVRRVIFSDDSGIILLVQHKPRYEYRL